MSAWTFNGWMVAAAEVVASTESEWAVRFLRELGRSQAKEFLVEALKGIALGGLLGLAIAVVVYCAFRHLGWFDSPWRHARWYRAGTLILTMIVAGLLMGAAGFWSGVLRGTERVLLHSQLGTDVLPRIGDLVADGMAWLQFHGTGAPSSQEGQVAARLERFRSGEIELDAASFLDELDRLQDEVIRRVVGDLERAVLDRRPQLKGGFSEKLIHHFLAGFGASLVEKKAESELKKWGADRVLRAIREHLLAEAAKAGNPRQITRQELSAFVVREGVIPGILSPIRSAARSQQVVLVGITAAIVVFPPVALRLGRRSSAGRPASPDASVLPP